MCDVCFEECMFSRKRRGGCCHGREEVGKEGERRKKGEGKGEGKKGQVGC